MSIVNLDRSLTEEIDDSVRNLVLAVKQVRSYRSPKAKEILRSLTNMRDIELSRDQLSKLFDGLRGVGQ